MSNAKATIESSIISGLSKRANDHPVRANHADILVPDILEALFSPHVRWAIVEYLRKEDNDTEAKEKPDEVMPALWSPVPGRKR